MQTVQGKFELHTNKGHPQLVSFTRGSSGQFGSGAQGGKAGIASKGGCGEYSDSCKVSGRKRECKSHSDCDGHYKGKDCLPNSKGTNGHNGQTFSNNASPVTSIKIDNNFLIDAGTFQLDMLFNYAIFLANQETMDESQEILVYLTKFQGHIGYFAKKMLDRMGPNGQLETNISPIDIATFDMLSSKLSRTISRGRRLEDLLNNMGMSTSFVIINLDIHILR